MFGRGTIPQLGEEAKPFASEEISKKLKLSEYVKILGGIIGVEKSSNLRFPSGWLRRSEHNPKLELPPAIIGIPFSRWGANPFIAHPFPCPVEYYEQVIQSNKAETLTSNISENPIQTGLAWQKALKANSSLTKAKIARENGISRARVTQIMNLLKAT